VCLLSVAEDFVLAVWYVGCYQHVNNLLTSVFYNNKLSSFPYLHREHSLFMGDQGPNATRGIKISQILNSGVFS